MIFRISQIICFVLLISASIFPLRLIAGKNGVYEEGLEVITLTEEEREDLLKYAGNSKSTLKKALQNAQGKNLDEMNRIYRRAIIQVVARSFKEKKRSELLMRITLNQALKLTHGTPTPDGILIKEPGVLSDLSNTDLLTAILEESIKFAIHYYISDRKAIKGGTLINLPYTLFADERLILARDWLSAIHDMKLMYAFEREILGQWKNTVERADNLERLRSADRLSEVYDGLSVIDSKSYSLPQKVRHLRGVIGQISKTKSMDGITAAITKSIESKDLIPGFYVPEDGIRFYPMLKVAHSDGYLGLTPHVSELSDQSSLWPDYSLFKCNDTDCSITENYNRKSQTTLTITGKTTFTLDTDNRKNPELPDSINFILIHPNENANPWEAPSEGHLSKGSPFTTRDPGYIKILNFPMQINYCWSEKTKLVLHLCNIAGSYCIGGVLLTCEGKRGCSGIFSNRYRLTLNYISYTSYSLTINDLLDRTKHTFIFNEEE